MREEWREYWKYFFLKSRSILWFIPVSLLFYIGGIVDGEQTHPLQYLFLCLSYGLTVTLCISVFYSVFWAVITKISIKTGYFYNPGLAANFVLSVSASMTGVFLAEHWQAWYLRKPISNQNLLSLLPSNAIIPALFINISFLFYYAYREAKEKELELKIASAEATYHSLKNQMQPHFLFNSLNSLSELIVSNSETASEMTQKLADLYREILEGTKQKTMHLSSEISIVKKYLELETLRFGERLKYQLNIPEELASVYLPSLVLQTLVENAIKHGISKSLEGGEVSISASKISTKKIQILVKNTSADLSEPRTNSGTGLANTQSRLNLLYGPSHGFTLSETAGIATASFYITGEKLA